MIQQGKHEAYSQLIEQNTTLSRAVAMQFAKHHSNTILICDDYEQEGRIALLDAAKRYCPEKGKFQVLHVFLGKSQQRKDCKKSTDDF